MLASVAEEHAKTSAAAIPEGRIDAPLTPAEGSPRGSSLDREFNRALLESMSDGVVACDSAGVLTLFNRVAREWHGADPAQLRAEEWPSRYDLCRADGVTPLPAGEVPLARAFRGEPVVDEGMAIAVPGRPVRFVLANGSVIADETGRKLGAVVVMRDVTALRRAEAELRRANEVLEARVGERTAQLQLQNATLRGIVEGAAAPVFSVDRQYRYTSFNRQHAQVMAAIYGVQIELGLSLLDCMTVPEDRAEARQNLDRALAGESFAQEAFSGDAGSRRYFRVFHGPIRSDSGAAVGVAVFATDLTDHRRAEEEVIERERRYRDIFDNVLDGVYLLDVEGDGRFRTVEVNPALERVTGIPRSSSVGKTQEETVDAETARAVNAKYRRCVEEGRPMEEELALLLPSGLRYIHSTLIPARGRDGRITRIVGISRDVTDARRNGAINAARLHLMQFAASHSLDEILEETLNQAEKVTGSLIGFLHFVDDDQQALTLQNWSTRTKTTFCKAAGKGSHYSVAQAGVWVDCVHRRVPVIHNDYAALPHRKGLPEGHAPVIRELVVPVLRGPKVVAILGVGNKPLDYGAEDAETLSLLADLAWEIADRKRAEESLRRLNRQLRAISECNQALMRATDEQAILNDVCHIICDQAGYRMAWVGFVERDPGKTIRPVACAGDDEGYVAEARLSWDDSERGRGPAGATVRSGRTITIQDLAQSPEFTPWLEAARARGYRSGCFLPLQDEDRRVFGLLLIYSAELDAFSPGEVRLLEELAGDLAFGITVLRGRAGRKAAERSIALLSFALNNVRESAFLIDEHGAFRYVNDEACRILGYDREALLRCSVPDVDPDFTAERWPAHWEELKERQSLHFEGRHRARDGHVFPVEISACYFEYEGQGYDLALAHDITERRKLEEQLRQAQKMEAIGTLAGGVAHDFNNVLTGIIGYGSLIQESLEPDSPFQSAVEQILGASHRAAQLTRGLLAFSRKQIINPKPTDLNEVVRNVERLLRRLIGEDVELSLTLAAEPLVVLIDAGQLEQVLMNLAANARDAMPDGGLLCIATQAVALDEAWVTRHGWGTPGPFALVSVSDNGIGMDEATRQKAFEPFFTTKELGKGTGLGLSIVYGIVKQHGGTVDLYSEPGKGTSFKILFPLVAAAVEQEAPRVVAPAARGTETILLAEDDRIVRGMLLATLTGHGYRVIEAVDGEDALEKFAAHEAEVDLLILDVVMPRKSGRDVYDGVTAVRPGVGVLFLSGYTADIIHKKGIFDEGLEFMSKPLSPADLLRRVRNILDRRPPRAVGPH